MVTNNIQALQPGEGNYNFLLNAQGRILGDCTIYRDPIAEPAAFLLETDTPQIDVIQQHLDHFIVMDDVELERLEARAGVLLAGLGTGAVLNKLGIATELPQQHLTTAYWQGEDFPLIHAHSPLVPRWELWIGKNIMPSLAQALIAAGATPVSPEALETLRILEGTPRYGIDIRNSEKAHDLPQETGQTRALHFSKGCYLGQEIVERIRSRGNVHRTFSGFSLTGSLPAPGAALTADGKPVGELTSVAAIPLPPSSTQPAHTIQLAFGYIRREALPATAQARNATLEYPGGVATPIALPYPVPRFKP
jgi:aminomethyltransferase